MTENPTVNTNEAILRIGKDVWWVLLVRGIVAIAFGIIALAWPDVTARALIVIVGIFWVIDGVVTAVRAIQARKVILSWVWWLAAALVSVVAGIVLLVWPGATLLVLAYMIGIWAILLGLLEVIGAFQVMANGGQWGGPMVAGAITLVFGIVMVIWHTQAITALIWLIGIFALVFGVLFVIGAFQVRSAARRAGVA